MKAVVATFNQERALVGAFSLIVKTDCETDGSSAALVKAQLTMQKRRGSGSHVVRMLYVPLEIMFILQEGFCEMHDLGDVTSTFHTISIASSGHQFLSLICNNL